MYVLVEVCLPEKVTIEDPSGDLNAPILASLGW